MPAPPESRAPAGISSPQDVDVTALFERLKEELRAGAAVGPDGRRSNRQSARAAAGRFWPVSAERPLTPGGGPRGFVKRLLQRTIRRSVRWYVEPFAADQRSFNDAALKLIDDLYELVDALSERAERADVERGEDARLLREVDERVHRLERRRPQSVPAPAAQPGPPAQPAPPLADYFAFETRMRPADVVREHQRAYVEDLRDHAPVLDVGCGRGELLALLRDAGVEARGIDTDPDMVDYARGEGLDVEQADALGYLEQLDDDALGAVFAGQVVEHLPPNALVRFLELARAKLSPGGLFVAETINPLSPIAIRHYFADLTHAQPLVPETLELLARQAGFERVETRYLNEPERKLQAPADDPILAANVARLNEVVFAPLDYAILARA